MIKEEAVESRAEIKSFDQGKLKHVETEEKNPLPTAATLKEELRPETLPDVSAVSEFDSSKLKHVETEDKTVLPTAEVIKEEAAESRAEVKSFDQSKLKHVETEEKNPLPTAATLKEELRPETLPDVSAVSVNTFLHPNSDIHQHGLDNETRQT